jgi:sugar phosphate isomerase/epimerase
MVLELAINTDFVKDTGNPEPYLKKISEAGFTHIHWCHEWDTDYIYSELEIKNIIKLLIKYNLKVLDLHGSEGKENNWISKNESIRTAGVELVKNRIFMANKLSCEIIVMHFMREPINDSEKQEYWDILHKSLNELKPYALKYNIKIALENYNNDECKEIKKLLFEYDSNFLGFCYDSGHGNIGNGLEALKELKDRLISIHLHDNDGITDYHKYFFSGTVDWDELAKILVKSSYKKEINMEVNIKHSNISDEALFLSETYAAGRKFLKLIETYSSNL